MKPIRQNTSPIEFSRTNRVDTANGKTSLRAGLVYPMAYVPLLRGDSASGSFALQLTMGDQPRPIMNQVIANMQAWFVPKSAHPQFSGHDEFIAAYNGAEITAADQVTRTAPPFYNVVSDGPGLATIRDSLFAKTLGIHTGNRPVNTDLIDAYRLIQNFRLRAHSDKLPLGKYAVEDLAESLELQSAFWPYSRFADVVPDYDRALVVGSLDLDILQGAIPIAGINRTDAAVGTAGIFSNSTQFTMKSNEGPELTFNITDALSSIYSDFAGSTVTASLMDIDKARTTQAYAKLRTTLAGLDYSGYIPEESIMAELMQGFRIPPEMFRRPMLLGSSKVAFGFDQRFATDSGSLDQSLSRGVMSGTFNYNVPSQETGGVIMITCEVLPESIHERQSDEFLHLTSPSQLPNAQRDTLRTEPVDNVYCREVDVEHTDPDTLYGYRPMNTVWNRDVTRLGGSFYQDDPEIEWTEQRSALWLSGVVDPYLTANHWLAPKPFPHAVFSDPDADACEGTFRNVCSISGLTQMGDPLAEDGNHFDAVASA